MSTFMLALRLCALFAGAHRGHHRSPLTGEEQQQLQVDSQDQGTTGVHVEPAAPGQQCGPNDCPPVADRRYVGNQNATGVCKCLPVLQEGEVKQYFSPVGEDWRVYAPGRLKKYSVILSFGAADLGFEAALAFAQEVEQSPAEKVYIDAMVLPTLPGAYRLDRHGPGRSLNAFWEQYYQEVMEQVERMVFLVTDAWSRSQYCWQELSWAMDMKKKGKLQSNCKLFFAFAPTAGKALEPELRKIMETNFTAADGAFFEFMPVTDDWDEVVRTVLRALMGTKTRARFGNSESQNPENEDGGAEFQIPENEVGGAEIQNPENEPGATRIKRMSAALRNLSSESLENEVGGAGDTARLSVMTDALEELPRQLLEN